MLRLDVFIILRQFDIMGVFDSVGWILIWSGWDMILLELRIGNVCVHLIIKISLQNIINKSQKLSALVKLNNYMIFRFM
jgi:hypothetical protein